MACRVGLLPWMSLPGSPARMMHAHSDIIAKMTPWCMSVCLMPLCLSSCMAYSQHIVLCMLSHAPVNMNGVDSVFRHDCGVLSG